MESDIAEVEFCVWGAMWEAMWGAIARGIWVATIGTMEGIPAIFDDIEDKTIEGATMDDGAGEHNLV
eukprot:1394492-Amorphochlora_amoeboformis.AAC.2